MVNLKRPTGTIPDTSVVHQQLKFAVCVRSSDQGDVNCSSIIFSLTAVLMLGGGEFLLNLTPPPTTPLKNKTKTNYLCWTVKRFCELARQSMNLNLIAGSFSRMRFLLSWETIRANQLWTQSFHKSCFRTAARVPPFLPTLSLKGIKSIDFVVIIIAFINRGYKTEQSPLEVVSPQGQVELMAFLNMAECI